MDEIISAAEANRGFSRLLRGVRAGRSYIVTAHGLPIARVVSIDEEPETDLRMRDAAKQALLKRLEDQPAVDIGDWTRDELYDR